MRLINLALVAITLLGTACQAVTAAPTLTRTPSPTAPPSTPTPAPALTVTPTASPSATAGPPPARGGMATLGLVGQPQSLNPIVENNPALRQVAPLLFDSLLQADPASARLQPGLAQAWDYAADGKQVTFQLPPGLTWSDGAPFTAAAVAESLQATQHPALLSFSDISTPDDETLTLSFINIDCGAVTALALLPLLPAAQVLEATPAGSGPFAVSSWSDDGRTLSLAPNANYRGPAPLLDGLAVRFLGEDEVKLALSEGQFDALGPLPFDLAGAAPAGMAGIDYPSAEMVYVAVNFAPRNDKPLAPPVRQALLTALDRETILSEALGGAGQLLAGSLPAGHWAANTALSPPGYNPAAAQELLAEAGLADMDGDGWLDRDGQRLELAIRLNGQHALHQRVGWLASSYYRDLGLFARAESVPPDSVIDDLFRHDFTLAVFSWPVPPDPDQRRWWRSTENSEGEGLNFVSYNNPTVDDLLDQANAVPGCEPDARAALYAEAQEILSRERPVDFLLVPGQRLLAAGRLQGMQPGPFAPFTWNAGNWIIK